MSEEKNPEAELQENKPEEFADGSGNKPNKHSLPMGCFSVGAHTFIYTGKGVYRAGPAAVPAAFALAAYLNRDKGAAFVQDILDMFPSLKNVFGTRDKGLEIGDTADQIQVKRDSMDVEEEVGKLRREIDVTSDIDHTLDILREIHEDYSSSNARCERAKSSIRTATTRFANKVGSLFMEPVDSNAEMLRLEGILEQVKEYNSWEAYKVGRPYFDEATTSEMDSLKEKGRSLEQAVNILQTRKNHAENLERYKKVKKELPGLIEQFQQLLDGIDETHNLQSSLSDVTKGYGSVIQADLRVYLRTRDPKVVEKLKSKIKEDMLAEALSKMEDSQVKSDREAMKFDEFLTRLQALKDRTAPAVERLEALKENYLQAGALRDDYNTLGTRFSVDRQQQALEQLDERLEEAKERTNLEIKSAESNEKYMKVNSGVPELHGLDVPSKSAYNIYDAASFVAAGLLVLGAAYVYTKRAYNRAKNKVLGKD